MEKLMTILSILKYYLLLVSVILTLVFSLIYRIFSKLKIITRWSIEAFSIYILYSMKNRLKLENILMHKIHISKIYFFRLISMTLISTWSKKFFSFKNFFTLRLTNYFYDRKTLKFKKYRNPQVSIIIPTYKDLLYTRRCLKSISNSKSKISYEIILIDDSPPNAKVRELSEIENIKLISNNKNIGYLKSCNLGVKKSNAKFICLLNNDTQVSDFWLDELIRTFSLFPKAGIVGSKLLNENLLIQEMGSYIFYDGNGYNFGRNKQNSVFENFVREVTYCSAASVLLKRSDFIKVNGFDHDYYPAYYEDVDLAFKLRELGKKTYCNPRSEVIHTESVSMGKTDNSKKSQYMKKNREVFLSKWQSKINKNFLGISDLPDQTKTIIIFEENILTPKQDAGSLSIFNFAKLFQSLGLKVIFIFKYGNILEDNFRLLQEHGFQIIIERNLTNTINLKKIFKDNYLNPIIFYIARPDLFNEIFPNLKKSFKSVFFIYDTVDLHFLRIKRQFMIENNPMIDENKVMKLQNMEITNINNADLAIIRSEFESNYLEENFSIKKDKILKLSLLFDIPKKFPLFNKTEGIVFIANFNHLPNIDALDFFINDIYKHLSKRVKNANFYIVGKSGEKLFKNKVSRLNSKFIFLDFVDEINEFLFDRRLNIAPLRYGAGIKGKIAQSFICGLPNVSTNIGFEGMSPKITKQMLANNAVDFAKKIDEIYFTNSKWNKAQKDIIKYSKKWSLNENYKLVQLALDKRGISLNKKHQAVKLL